MRGNNSIPSKRIDNFGNWKRIPVCDIRNFSASESRKLRRFPFTYYIISLLYRQDLLNNVICQLIILFWTDQYLRQGQGFLMVYSIDNLESFKKLKTLHNQMLRVKDEPSFPVVIVGNKSDLEELRDVQFSDGQAFARSINAPFIEVSL